MCLPQKEEPAPPRFDNPGIIQHSLFERSHYSDRIYNCPFLPARWRTGYLNLNKKQRLPPVSYRRLHTNLQVHNNISFMPFTLRVFVFLFLMVSLTTCADPVTPVYRYETGFLLIEGRITDQDGYSEIRLSRNEILFGVYQLTPVEDAVVSSVDDDGQEVAWEQMEETNRYRPPVGWAAAAGKSYQIRAVTPQGEVIESTSELMPTNVPIQEARVKFEQEAYFSTAQNRFIPAFRMLLDLEDPGDEENFYNFGFTAWETIAVCASCERSRWRNGQCIAGPDTRFVRRWDYLCDMECWISAQGGGRNILSDAFINGNRVDNIEVGRFDFKRKGGLLFVLEQYNVTKEAFAFSEVLEGISEGSGGLNAPLPAALIGNLTDLSENKTNVLGYVSVAAVNIERIYFDRDTVNGEPLPFSPPIILEPADPSPPRAPCVGGTRTAVRPEGWPN